MREVSRSNVIRETNVTSQEVIFNFPRKQNDIGTFDLHIFVIPLAGFNFKPEREGNAAIKFRAAMRKKEVNFNLNFFFVWNSKPLLSDYPTTFGQVGVSQTNS